MGARPRGLHDRISANYNIYEISRQIYYIGAYILYTCLHARITVAPAFRKTLDVSYPSPELAPVHILAPYMCGMRKDLAANRAGTWPLQVFIEYVIYRMCSLHRISHGLTCDDHNLAPEVRQPQRRALTHILKSQSPSTRTM